MFHPIDKLVKGFTGAKPWQGHLLIHPHNNLSEPHPGLHGPARKTLHPSVLLSPLDPWLPLL